jgi:hypothetical protein
VQEIRTLYPSEWNVPYPAGLAYATEPDRLFMLDRGSSGPTLRALAPVVIITPYEDLVATVKIAFTVDDAINMTYDDANDHLLLLNHKRASLAQVAFGEDGLHDPNMARFDVAHLDLENADGMAVDPAGRRLFILDSGASQVVSANLDDKLELMSTVDLKHVDSSKLRGIAVHPRSHNLFVLSPAKELLYELTQSGQLVNQYDLASLDLIDPRALAFAPSADLTDDPDTIHLYMTDSNLPAEGWVKNRYAAPAETEPVFGRIVEVAIDPGVGHVEPCSVTM